MFRRVATERASAKDDGNNKGLIRTGRQRVGRAEEGRGREGAQQVQRPENARPIPSSPFLPAWPTSTHVFRTRYCYYCHRLL